jgi:hypothetical protein
MKFITLFAVASLVVACGDDAPSGSGVPTAALSADLRQLREEEKLARDTYRTLADVHSAEIFPNIADSEQSHMDAVGRLLTSYAVADPVTNDARGVFQSEEFVSLYADLVAQGKSSPQSAYVVGATVEELDIRDIRVMRGRTAEPDVLAVYDRLECGSRNHLRSFVRQLSGRFEPQFLTAAEVSTIVGGANESCR